MTSKGKKYSGYSHLGYKDEATNSASLAQAQRMIKELDDDNKQLKEELTEVKSAYIQLTKESPEEKFDERRVTFLKSQIIQLERQILLLNEALGSRMTVVVEAENSLGSISETCKNYLEQEGRIGEVYVSKDDLKDMIKSAESARHKLYKNIENTSMQRLHKPLQFMDTFIKPSCHRETTLLDICSGKIEHINIKQVAKLESKLCQVYKQLLAVNQCLNTHVFSGTTSDKESHLVTRPQTPKANFVKLYGESSRACCLLNELLPELLELSILVPAAPLPVLKKCIVRELTVDNVMAKLPVLSKSKSQETRDVIEALLKVLSLIQLKCNTQEKVYKEELKFHKSVYQLQLEYIDNLFRAIRLGYRNFEEESNKLICQPMKEILRIYETLQTTASEDALRMFLKVFKQSHSQVAGAIEKLKVQEKGDEALSSFGEEFFDKLYQMELDCQSDRDDNIHKLQDVKEQQEQFWTEIKRRFFLDEDELENNKNILNSGRKTKHKNHSKTEQINPASEPTVQSCNFQYDKEPLPVIKSPDHTTFMSDKARKYNPDGSFHKNEHDYEKNLKTDIQSESEELFKATLRGGYDEDDKGFVFDSPRADISEKDETYLGNQSGRYSKSVFSTKDESNSSICTCGADEHEHSTHDHSNKNTKNRAFNMESKPPMSRSRLPTNVRSNSPVTTKKSTGKLMKGVPRSKLTLKSRARSLDNASDSESETGRQSPVLSFSRSSSFTMMENSEMNEKQNENICTGNKSVRKRSGSLPRSKPAVSHWR